jgi:hypothetical protein
MRYKSQSEARQRQMCWERGKRLQIARIFLNWLLTNNNVSWNFQIMFPFVLDYIKKRNKQITIKHNFIK